jgi:DNA polymerase III delta prime subunit
MELFIHKYKPTFFADFERNSEIIPVLQAFIQMDSLSILFVGEKGSGKTCLLHAIIREYYTGYSHAEYKDNILYINNLMDQGINYYRNDVKIFCQTSCSISKKKKFIVLDDLDFMNEQSQQVFRNSMDKYGKNVHFLASCTNIQKVIENLQSRFMIMRTKLLEKEYILNIMNQIIQQEQIVMDEKSKEFILCISNNNVKTVINYLEKCKLLNEPIRYDIVVKVCTNISFPIFEEYILSLREKKIVYAIQLLNEVAEKGYSVIDILDSFFLFVKTSTHFTEDEKYQVIPVICKYINIFHNIHEDEIELSLFTNNLFSILFIHPILSC